jgi:hypothetical protein
MSTCMTYFFSVASHALKSLEAMTFELDHLFICTDVGADGLSLVLREKHRGSK